MKASTREWVAKAEEDFLAATALNRRRLKPLWSVVAFHVQQTVEKYLKARLEEAGCGVPKTHDLLHLLNLVTAGRTALVRLPIGVQPARQLRGANSLPRKLRHQSGRQAMGFSSVADSARRPGSHSGFDDACAWTTGGSPSSGLLIYPNSRGRLWRAWGGYRASARTPPRPGGRNPCSFHPRYSRW